MKIQRFNESFDSIYSEPELKKSKMLSKKINDFIIDFSDATDDGIIEWISYISGTESNLTKLVEYRDLTNPKNLQELAKSKNLTTVKEYADLDNESNELIEKMKALEKEVEVFTKKKGEIMTLTYNEILYKFQEDLILKDFEGFYGIFIEDYVKNLEIDALFDEVHPEIIKKYGKTIKKTLEINYPDYVELMMKNDMNKYNL